MFGFNKSVFGIACIVILALSSCRTTRIVTTTAEARPITTGKLIRNIESNAFKYKYLAIKRISCQFDNGKTKTSFKASILAEKDKRITVMLTKLNIPLGRLWLTPDSVKFINYIEKTYFIDNYNYLSSLLGIDLDFQTIDAIISNNVISLRSEKGKDNKDYETRIDTGMYILESVKKLQAEKIDPPRNNGKSRRKSKKLLESALVHQSLYVDAGTFKLRKILMQDSVNSRNLNIEFSDFTAIEKQIYPGDIFIHFLSPENNLQMKIKLAGFSTKEENEVRFKVPEQFTRINN